MKRFLTALLAAVMVAAMAVPAMAAEPIPENMRLKSISGSIRTRCKAGEPDSALTYNWTGGSGSPTTLPLGKTVYILASATNTAGGNPYGSGTSLTEPAGYQNYAPSGNLLESGQADVTGLSASEYVKSVHFEYLFSASGAKSPRWFLAIQTKTAEELKADRSDAEYRALIENAQSITGVSLSGSVAVTYQDAQYGFNGTEGTLNLNLSSPLKIDASEVVLPPSSSDPTVSNANLKLKGISNYNFRTYSADTQAAVTPAVTKIDLGSSVYLLTAAAKASDYNTYPLAEAEKVRAYVPSGNLLESGAVFSAGFVGKEYLKGISFQYLNSSSTSGGSSPRWFLSFTAKEEGELTAGQISALRSGVTLSGTITIPYRNTTAGGIDTGFVNDITVDLTGANAKLQIAPPGADSQKIVTGINSTPVMTKRNHGTQDGRVAAYNWDDKYVASGVTYIPWGKTVYLTLKDGSGTIVSDEFYVKNAVISPSWTAGGDYVKSVELVSEYYDAGVSKKKYFIAVSIKPESELGSLPTTEVRLEGSIGLTKTGEAAFDVSATLALDLGEGGTGEQPAVTGINSTPVMTKRNHGTQDGRVAAYDWNDKYVASGVTNIPWGKTVYLTLRNNSGTVVSDAAAVSGAVLTPSWIAGGDYVKSVELASEYYDADVSKKKYYIAISIKPEEELKAAGLPTAETALEGSIRLARSGDPAYDVSAGLAISLGKTETVIDDPQRVAGIRGTAMCRFNGLVASWTPNGEPLPSGQTSVTEIGWGDTVFYTVDNAAGNGTVTDGNYLSDFTVESCDFEAVVEKISFVRAGSRSNPKLEKYYLAITFKNDLGAGDYPVNGSVVLKKTGENGFATADNTITANVNLTLLSDESLYVAAPRTEENQRVAKFAEFGFGANKKVYALVETDEGYVERYLDAINRASVTGSTYCDYGDTVYFLLEDVAGNRVIHHEYVDDLKIKVDWLDNSQMIEKVDIVMQRFEDGREGAETDYCYFLAVTFVDRPYSYRLNATGTITLTGKSRKYGIANDDHEISTKLDIWVGPLDSTTREDYYNRHFFGDRRISDVPTRYNFEDPSYEEGGDNYDVGTDEEDVIYLWGTVGDCYFTVDTRKQGKISLYNDVEFDPYFGAIYEQDADIQFINCNDATFHKNGILTIAVPDESYYVYEIKNNILMEIPDIAFNENECAYEFRTRHLRRYMISSEKLDLDKQFYIQDGIYEAESAAEVEETA